MTETEWLESAAPTKMLEFLKGKASDRKLRLFAVACARSCWHLLSDQRSRDAVESGERVADTSETSNELESMYREAWAAVPLVGSDLHMSAARAAGRTVQPNAHDASRYAVNEIVELHANSMEDEEGEHAYWKGKANAEGMLASALRDIFGNPFRPVIVDPSRLNHDIIDLARLIYNERAFNRMPELADALQAAGCADEDILKHCRGTGPHVRGCWVIDVALGKS